MPTYSFTTNWTVEAPVELVWNAITHSIDWPEWWRGVEKVVELAPGDADGLGGVHRSTWKSALPYRLTFDSTVTRVERHTIYEIRATGQLEGTGLWTFTSAGATTRVSYDWNVIANKPWMRILAPVARPLFRWNHDVIMRWGHQGLSNRLAHEPTRSTARN